MKRHPTHPARRIPPWIFALALAVCAGVAGADSPAEPALDGFYQRWLTGASAWMLEAEREAFEALESDVEREVFIRRFWQARTAAQPVGDGTAPARLRRDRLLARWQLNFEEARHRFETLDDQRAQALLIAGKPAQVVVFPGCRSVVRPLRVWSYQGGLGRRPGADRSGDGGELHLVFWLDGGIGGSYRLWSPDDGATPLIAAGPARHHQWSVEEVIDYTQDKGCFRFSRSEAGRVAAALRGAAGPDDLRQLVGAPPADLGWLDRLAAELAGDEALDAALPATVEIHLAGGYQRKTVVQGRVAIPADLVGRNAEGLLFDRFVITGDVKLGDRLADTFRVVHLVAGAAPKAPAGGDQLEARPPTIVLDFYRRLRPGSYTLSLRVEDSGGLGLLRQVRALDVPAAESAATPPAGRRLGLPGLTRSEVGVLTTFPGVEILPPARQLLLGEVEVEAVTTGGPIERLEFLLDGQAAGSDGEPPYAATLDLGTEPRPRRLEAVAFDPAGREIARDAATLNAGPRRFAVRLVSPLPGSGGRRAEVEVDVPEGRRLESLKLFVNQRLIATLKRPPFVHPLPAPEPGVTTYVRALATLDGGESMEDLVFVHSPDPFDRVDVQLVELYTSVRDRRGRFVTGLTAGDFRVLEDGAPQQIRRFDTVENLAINVALAMDVSSSMRKKIGVATRSAQRFFDTVLTPGDLASFLTFNHDVRQVVPFTGDAYDLRQGVSGFRAWGTTRLHDGIVYAVHSFGGLEGKRALVLLSDGHDVDSDFYFKQVLELVLRSGVAVYPIALGIENSALTYLAEVSGGRFYQIVGAGELDEIYRQIEEELRSQYLLVYEPPATGRRDLRRVEVQVLREGLEARSIHGYYP